MMITVVPAWGRGLKHCSLDGLLGMYEDVVPAWGRGLKQGIGRFRG